MKIQGEVFVYNRAVFSKGDTSRPSITPLPTPFSFGELSTTPSDKNSLESWQKLFRERRAWAIDLSTACGRVSRELKKYDQEAAVIQRATAIAVESVKQHVNNLHQKYAEAKTWAEEYLDEQSILLARLPNVLDQLLSIPSNPTLLELLSKPETMQNSDSSHASNSLRDCVSIKPIQDGSYVAQSASSRLSTDLADMVEKFEEVVSDSSSLVENFHHEFTNSVEDAPEQGKRLVEEIEALARKISADYETSLSLSNTPKSLNAIARTAQLHAQEFLPAIKKIAQELDLLLHKTVAHRNKTAVTSQAHLQKISLIQSGLVEMQARLDSIDVRPAESAALNAISFVVNLVSLYGSLLVEAFHRYDWDERMKKDSSAVAEELAVIKGEEERRRRKWLKGMGDYLAQECTDVKVLGLEINLKEQKKKWPRTLRQDVDDFMSTIFNLGGFEDVITEMNKALEPPPNPAKQRMRRSKIFKNGNLNDGSFVNDSQMISADGDLIKNLQSERTKLEDRLRGSESRVRKLEDLLHRQTQLPQTSTGPVFSHPNAPHHERHTSSPIMQHAPSSPKMQENLSRRSSVSSRRFSSNQGNEEKLLVQRLVKLEAELNAEKIKSHDLREATQEKVSIDREWERRLEEALSTKKDLMENFMNQQREFDDERRLHVDEATTLKVRLEEIEDELERVLGSRDDEKNGIDDRIQALEAEIGSTRKEGLEAQKQAQMFQIEYTREADKVRELERQLGVKDNEIKHIQNEYEEMKYNLQGMQEAQAYQTQTLRSAHQQLARDERSLVIPETFDRLIDAIEILSEKSASHLAEVREALEVARVENASIETESKKKQDEIMLMRERLGEEARKVLLAYENLSQEKGRYEALQAEFDDERSELFRLRSQFASGRTDADTLRSRLADEEEKVTSLSTKLASATKLVQNLEEELSDRSSKIWDLNNSIDVSKEAMKERGQRAEGVSTHIYSLIERLLRLLVHIGFSINKQGDTMAFQRLPKISSASTTLPADPSQSLNRSLSQPLASTTSTDQLTPAHVFWAQAPSSFSESEQYALFDKYITSFSSDAFSEAIIKRIKEAEHLARKWQREAKSYRDKAHRFQSESHDKIAFRGFKEGDLALFLPTRNQATRPWAAFNVGAPHYFLRETDSHRLRSRDWLLARIAKVEERVVDLSRSMLAADRRSLTSTTSDGNTSIDDENPFELSDGLRWYLLDAAEEKAGAPTTPGPGKTTVAAANVDAKGSIQPSQRKKSTIESGATKTLTRSLDSRRSSANSKKSLTGATVPPVHKDTILESESKDPEGEVAESAAVRELSLAEDQGGEASDAVATAQPRDNDAVRKDLLWGP